MADSEFEEFRNTLDTFPSHLKSTSSASPFYTLVPDLTEDDYPSSKSDSSDQEEDPRNNGHRNNSIGPTNSSTPSHKPHSLKQHLLPHTTAVEPSAVTSGVSKSSDEDDDDIGDGLRTLGGVGGGVGVAIVATEQLSTTTTVSSAPKIASHAANLTTVGGIGPQVERRRRKLPEIPKNRKSFISPYMITSQSSLADELAYNGGKIGGGGGVNTFGSIGQQINGGGGGIGSSASSLNQRSMLAMKCGYLLDEDSSPDSERLTSLGDVDSGHSTAHSPTDFKSMSPPPTPLILSAGGGGKHSGGVNDDDDDETDATTVAVDIDDCDGVDAAAATAANGAADANGLHKQPFQPPAFGGIPYSQIEMLEPTHRGLHKFVPRHRDEIDVEIGDPVYVQREADDLWCEGVNLRTGRQGIFPSAYAVDLDYNDFDPSAPKVKLERYLLGYLGSVETSAHKGTGVVCQAVRKIVGEFGESPAGQLCILEISDQGLRMVDRSKKQKKEPKKPCIDYFYSLKNVSFCAFHPRDHRYIGFITKHPTIQRFACHVFKGHESTRPVAEAVGRAFQHFYQKFIETAYPIEDIYIE